MILKFSSQNNNLIGLTCCALSYFTGDAADVILTVAFEVINTVRTRAKHARIRGAFVDVHRTIDSSESHDTDARVGIVAVKTLGTVLARIRAALI